MSGGIRMVDLQAQRRALGPAIDRAVARVMAHGRFVLGPEVEELEEQLARRVGVGHCVATASGTASLELVLRALGVGPGDEVITVPFTWVSTAAAVLLAGARPVFVDIDPRTFCMDMDQAAAAVGPATRALMPVSLFGHPADLEGAERLARRHGLALIEDGAQSFGARLGERRSCGVGTAGATSFFPSKPLGCYGEGGALFTRDEALARRLRSMRVHGESSPFRHDLLGTNGRLDTLQAAVLLAKLPAFDGELARRRALAAGYDRALGPWCRTPAVRPGCEHAYAQYTLRTGRRDDFRRHMRERGIPTGIYYARPLHLQPLFASLPRPPQGFPQAERACREVVSLPIHPYLGREDAGRVAGAALSFLEGIAGRGDGPSP